MKTKWTVPFFRSVIVKITAAIVLCLVCVLSANWLLNRFAFSYYYHNEKQAALVSVFEEIDEHADSEYRLNAFISRQKATVTMVLWTDHRLLYRDGTTVPGTLTPPPPLKNENGTYTISATPLRGQSAKFEALTLYGRTENGINVVLQTPLTDIQNSTAIANRFLLWSVLLSILVCVIAIWFLVRNVLRPLNRLSGMAHRMAELDFRERYTDDGQDELTVLGGDLNRVSQTMEDTLTQLKTANARLSSDIEKNERQETARRAFISNVSHELKTPIALIQTYAEGLKENMAENAEQREFYCDVIHNEAERLSQMITRMTMLMKLESGKADLQIEQFDIGQLCGRLLNRYEVLLKERHLQVPPLDTLPCFVWGDPSLIDNVMTNFLTNAIHHTEENGLIRFTWQPTERETVRIAVYNSGSSIPKSELPHIWESFYKVDKSHNREYGGSGIGLSVVAAVMRVHGMPYGVQNVDGGVEFFIELPRK